MTLSLTDLETIHLSHGSHRTPTEGYCLLEAVSMFSGEPFTDAPRCVSPYLRSFGIRLNDRATDAQRQDLRRFIPLVIGTARDGLDEQRRWIAADHTARVVLPKWLDKADLGDLAAECRALTPITDDETWRASRALIQRVRDVTYPLRVKRWDTYRQIARDAVAEFHARQDANKLATASDTGQPVADADADAAAVAAAVAAAAAAAAADAVAVAGDRWWTVRNATYNEVYAKVRAVYEERFADLVGESWADACGLYERLILAAGVSL